MTVGSHLFLRSHSFGSPYATTSPPLCYVYLSPLQLTELMDKFEKQQEDLDVQTSVMDNAMGATTANTMPEGQVTELMEQVADEHGIEMAQELDSTAAGPLGSTSTANAEQDVLAERLAQIRSTMS